MAKLPALSGKRLIRLLQSAGFQVFRQKGSHVSLQKGDLHTVVPLHDDLAKGTLLGILRQCRMTKNDLRNRLRK